MLNTARLGTSELSCTFQDHSTIDDFPKQDPYDSSILEMSHNTFIPATVENQLRRENTHPRASKCTDHSCHMLLTHPALVCEWQQHS